MGMLCTEHVTYVQLEQAIDENEVARLFLYVGSIPAWHAFTSAAAASQPHHRPSPFVHREYYLAVGSMSS